MNLEICSRNNEVLCVANRIGFSYTFEGINKKSGIATSYKLYLPHGRIKKGNIGISGSDMNMCCVNIKKDAITTIVFINWTM
jgi:hypothetical protein